MPKILGLIPARGGSKGIPRKNVRILGGKPLLAWTVEAAVRSSCLDRIILSTDDEEIASVGKQIGCEVPFLRPAELAKDETPGIEPVLHAIKWLKENEDYEPEFIMLLQPTSPFRTSEQIKEAVKLIQTREFLLFDSLVSVVKPDHSPEWMFVEKKDGRITPLLYSHQVNRRQELSLTYALNGAMYIARTETLIIEKSFVTERTMAFQMDKITSLDIDTMFDWKIAECFVRNGLALEE
ncbi:acylneuraminate cytidylyltransferase family protein [Paradesulfitobacterium ferrireducens]|uniref:acylneuraminate cytidylyltransferase family protein n=1 Tax=Paradesulfitobacterium ferrireducens TaxID=2816476 RepID=UPI001A906D1F|nr:acylneuraminate cytidylyltransferase family protein [Paradesulfitobacterium ferrireducens]